MGKAETSKTAEVDAYLAKLEHPFKGEVQAVREIIKGVNPHPSRLPDLVPAMDRDGTARAATEQVTGRWDPRVRW